MSDDLPHGDEPGAATTPYDDGQGTIGLQDRRGDAAPDTNQGKTEPMPPTPGHTDPAGTAPHTDPPQVPELDEMNAGRAAAQVASPDALPARRPSDPSPRAGTVSPGTVPEDDRPHPGTSSSTGSGSGPEMPESQTTGTAHRAPGLQGETPDGEGVESDTAAGAARMTPGRGDDATGDARGVPVPHETAASGTSQEQVGVTGIREAD